MLDPTEAISWLRRYVDELESHGCRVRRLDLPSVPWKPVFHPDQHGEPYATFFRHIPVFIGKEHAL